MKRREFIKLTSTASAIGLLPFEVNASMRLLNTFANCNLSNRKIVLINLKGGNDGLNTLVPLNDYSTYISLRPDVGLPMNQLVNFDTNLTGTNQDLGMHPALGGVSSFESLYGDGMLRILQSVGYPSQNKSHFASTDLYMTGNDGNSWDNGQQSGWIGRFMEHYYANEVNESYPLGIQIGSNDISLGFHGEHEHGLSLNINGQDPEGFYSVLNGLSGMAPDISNMIASDHKTELEYLIQTDALANTYSYAITNAFNSGSNIGSYDDNNDLANQLKTVARLIRGGLESKIFMVQIGGFDTHNNQIDSGTNSLNGKHTELLTELSQAVGMFMNDINSDSVGDDVVAITYSEFGRKAKQNGNWGTDHGEIAPMFVIGKPVNGGVSGTNVDLSEASSNNNWQIETYHYDYRQTFASLMQDFLGTDNSVIDNTFFDNTNTESFANKKISEILKNNYIVDPCCYSSLGVDFGTKVKEWRIQPNPFNDHIELLSKSGFQNCSYRIYDASSKLVLSGEVSTINDRMKINTSTLTSGIYLAQIDYNNVKQTIKIVKP